MKTKILSFLVLVCMVLIGTSAYAQPAQPGLLEASTRYANKGATTSYTVGGGATTGFVWAIRANGSNTGALPPFTASTSNVQSVTWTGTTAADIFYLDAYYVDANGCYSEMLTYTVTIKEVALCIATSTATINGVNVEDPDVTQTCSLIETGSGSKATGNGTSTYGGDVSTFYLTISGGLPSQDYSVVYSVGGTNQTAVTISTDATGAGAKEITVTTTDFVSLFENTTGASYDVTIAAVSATDINSFVTTSTCNYDIAVNAKPVISF